MKIPSQTPFVVLGIDQSLSGTGLTAIKADFPNISVLSTSLISSKLQGCPRLEEIILGLKTMVSAVQPQLIAMEDVTRMAASASLSALVELAGIIRLELFRMGYDVVVQNQSSMKKFSFGAGDTKKDSGYMLKVFDSTGERFNSDDEADAYLHARLLTEIAWIGQGKKTISSLRKYQQDTLLARARKESKLTESKFAKLTDVERMRFFCASYKIPCSY